MKTTMGTKEKETKREIKGDRGARRRQRQRGTRRVAGERKNNDDKGGQNMFLKHGMKRERDRKKEIEGMT